MVSGGIDPAPPGAYQIHYSFAEDHSMEVDDARRSFAPYNAVAGEGWRWISHSRLG
jgi:hypothetical protein